MTSPADRIDWALPAELRHVLDATPELSRAFLVGGCVRDALLGRAADDLDFEVYGVSLESLAATLARHGATDLVGRSFGVVKLRLASGTWVDFSVPRRDSKVAPGHRGFAVEIDPALGPRDAAARRDFTINAMSSDPRTGEVFDYFGGRADLEHRILRHTTTAFSEDPLRVLRGMQFAARFELAAAPETLALGRALAGAWAELALERVQGEWRKWATRSRKPSLGLEFLRESGWLAHTRELEALIGVPQDPAWHPEGDVWVHTLHALDALVGDRAWRTADEDTRAVLTYATLTHDMGKAAVTRREVRAGRERTVSPGHDTAGGPIAGAFLARIGTPASIVERVLPLVTQHMAHLSVSTPRAVRRLAARLEPESIANLAVVITADAGGRPPLPAGPPQGLTTLLSIARELEVMHEPPRPLLLGRHLLERGWTPGPAMGEVLAEAFEAQLDGAFADLDGALAWLGQRRPAAG